MACWRTPVRPSVDTPCAFSKASSLFSSRKLVDPLLPLRNFCSIVWGLSLWFELFRANSELAATGPHQFTQLTNAQFAHFMHPYQNGRAYWQAATPNLANNRWSDFK